MKKVILFFCLFLGLSSLGNAQHITDEAGKNYYDDAKTQLKEVYSYKKVTILNPRDPNGEVKKKNVKHGPYFYYYKSGELKINGQYKDGKKHGKWKYYSEDGKITKIEEYKNGELVNTNNDPEQPGEKPKDANEMKKKLEKNDS